MFAVFTFTYKETKARSFPLYNLINYVLSSAYFISHMLHVWNIYLHLPQKSSSFAGKYTIHGASGSYFQTVFMGININHSYGVVKTPGISFSHQDSPRGTGARRWANDEQLESCCGWWWLRPNLEGICWLVVNMVIYFQWVFFINDIFFAPLRFTIFCFS